MTKSKAEASNMKQCWRLLVLAVVSSAGLMTACGGGDSGDLANYDAPHDATANDDQAGADDTSQTDHAPDDAEDVAGTEEVVPVGPSIIAVPPAVDFTSALAGKAAGVEVQLKSVGDVVAHVTGISLEPMEGTTEFSLNFESDLAQGAPSQSRPLILPVGAETKFLVVYIPETRTQRDSTGWPVPDRALVRITYDGGGPIEVQLTGRSGLGQCPVAVLDVAEANPLVPQTIVHLSGDRSLALRGPITEWKWSVEQPEEHKFRLIDKNDPLKRTHEANVVGTYRYHLDVCDGPLCASDPQCGTDIKREFQADPPLGIHCELTWETPSDANEYDSGPGMGTDLDLHFANQWAKGEDLDGDGVPDGWFDLPYDVFWFNSAPEWGSVNPNLPDNPSLDRDDTDGAGPENLNLAQPTDGFAYRIGVHFWWDNGYSGPSYPRVKCYIDRALALDTRLERGLTQCELWEVATIEWPSRVVTPITDPVGGPKIYLARSTTFPPPVGSCP